MAVIGAWPALRAASAGVVARARTLGVSSYVLEAATGGVVVAIFSMLLLKWHAADELSVVPYHDGSHHVANVATLLAEI
jgi:hypothetical protein